jgi:predicted RNase H-like HicB family nuclease
MKYRVEITRDRTGHWLAEVPAVPGCHTHGRSLREVERRIREALGLWVEDSEEAEFELDVRLPSKLSLKLSALRSVREKADELQRQTSREASSVVIMLARGLGLSVRDTADLIGLSHQRVQQLIAGTPRTEPPPFDPDPQLIGDMERGRRANADRFRVSDEPETKSARPKP